MQYTDVIVIGGGAAGMMAAGTAASRGKTVILVEKNRILGKKMLITGKGRCNITNACEDVEELIQNVTTNRSFLYSAFYGFTNYDTIDFFNSLGVETKVERGNRVFPVSDKSSDVVNALIGYVKKSGVQIVHGSVNRILTDESGAVCGIELENGKKIFARSVIVATGGMSYRGTGSTGDGYKWAKTLGHTVVTPKPSLVPLEVEEQWAYELAKLYAEAGMIDKCIAECDDLALWFHNGEYVVQALELKKQYAPLTPEQQTIYDNPSSIVDMETKEAAIEAAVPTLDEEIMKEMPKSETEVIADSIMMDTEKEIAAAVTEHKEETTQEEQTTQTDQTTQSVQTTTQDGQTTESVEQGNKITIKKPEGVGVYFDGDYVGIAPVSIKKAAGMHTITLYKAGYLIKSYTIQAEDNGKDDEYSYADLISVLD